jgi:tungstate transport system substrate-binding protein
MLVSKTKATLLTLAALAMTLILVVVLSGCANSTSTSTANPAPITSTTTVTTVATQTATTTATATQTTTTTTTIAAKPANPDMILATTTSTQDSGLLDVLVPAFEKQSGYKVKTVAVGSGAAMTLGEKGEADVLLVHSPAAEVKFMEAKNGIARALVMHNDFIIVGPTADPTGLKGQTSAVEALKKIAAAGSLFISRGDKSGTDALEKKLWTTTGVNQVGQSWYQESGQGMGATLTIASEKSAYTITDRATYLANQSKLALGILVQGDPALLNVYHVILVDPAKSKLINAAGAKAFYDFMIAPATQTIIAGFGKDKYGQALFFPDAGKTDAEVGLK